MYKIPKNQRKKTRSFRCSDVEYEELNNKYKKETKRVISRSRWIISKVLM